jgi:hypothetical protein
MPDGDRFYRHLRGMGKGWVSIARMSCSNSDIFLLNDKALEAVADNLRSISDSVEKANLILHRAFEEERLQKRGLLEFPVNSFMLLEQELAKQSFQGDFQLNYIVKNSVKKVFLENKNDSLIITEAMINRKLEQTLAVEITASRLSCVRDLIMNEQNRTFSEQKEWEYRLYREIKASSKNLIRWDDKQIKKVRKPITRRIDRNATENILDRSLTAF